MSLAPLIDTSDGPPRFGVTQALSTLGLGAKGVISFVGPGDGAAQDDELERRLLELGFVEGARIELLHEGLFGKDPIAVRLDERRVALRRREARLIFVQLEIQV